MREKVYVHFAGRYVFLMAILFALVAGVAMHTHCLVESTAQIVGPTENDCSLCATNGDSENPCAEEMNCPTIDEVTRITTTRDVSQMVVASVATVPPAALVVDEVAANLSTVYGIAPAAGGSSHEFLQVFRI